MSPKKKKKKKKTKAEIEAERIAAEEEAKRIAEEEEKRREEERIRAEETAKRELAERIERRNMEVSRLIKNKEELTQIITCRKSQLDTDMKTECQEREWAAFLGCNTSQWPNTDPKNLNTFISEMAEEMSPSLIEVLACSEIIDRIVSDIESELIASRFSKDQLVKEKFATFVPSFHHLIMKQIDHATSMILHTTNEGRNVSSENLRVAVQNENMKVALWANLHMKEESQKLDFDDQLGIVVHIPKSLTSAHVAIRVIHTQLDITSSDRCYDDYIVLGGVFEIDILRMPPPFKKLDCWVIRHVSESTDEESSSFILDDSTDNFTGNIFHFICQVKIPSSVVVPNDLLLACWRCEEKKWITDAVSDYSYDTTNNTLSFQSCAVGLPIGLIQGRRVDLYYQDWTLGPVETDAIENQLEVVHLSITTPRFIITIEVKGSRCKLLSPDIPQLEHIRVVSHSPGDLLMALSKSGIHLMPVDSDMEGMKRSGETESESFILKTKEIEQKLCEDLSLLATSFFVKSSSFNRELGQHRACYQIKETDVFTGGCDPFEMYLAFVETDSESISAQNAPGSMNLPLECGKVKCSLFDTTDILFDESLDLSVLDGTRSNLHIMKCIEQFCTSESIECAKQASPLMTETLRQLLELTRPFSFC